MNICSISENIKIERRISITPEIAKKYISLGLKVSLPKNYGWKPKFKLKNALLKAYKSYITEK